MKQCSDENVSLIKRIKVLQTQNHDLMSKMKKLQTLLSRNTGKTAQPATCLMILLLSMALVTLPNLKLGKEAINTNELATAFGDQQNRRNLLFDIKSELEDLEPDDPSLYIPNEHDYVESVYKYVSQLSSEVQPSSLQANKAKRLIEYDIDSINEWEVKKRPDREGTSDDYDHLELPKIFDSDAAVKELSDTSKLNNSTGQKLSETERFLAQSIIASIAANAPQLQKSNTY